MVARYGNFVTYEPPVTPSTLILWLGPLLFVLIGASVIIMRARRQSGQTGSDTSVKQGVSASELSIKEQQRLAQLLTDVTKTESDGKGS